MNTENDNANQLDPTPANNNKNGIDTENNDKQLAEIIVTGLSAWGNIQRYTSESDSAKHKTFSLLWVVTALLIFSTSWILIWHGQHEPAVALISHVSALVAGYFAGQNKS